MATGLCLIHTEERMRIRPHAQRVGECDLLFVPRRACGASRARVAVRSNVTIKAVAKPFGVGRGRGDECGGNAPVHVLEDDANVLRPYRWSDIR